MKDWKNLVALVGLSLLVVAGGLLALGMMNNKKGTDADAWPNRGFNVPGKDAFVWKFPVDGQLKYVFKGRDKGLGIPASLYDPEGWQLTLNGDRADRGLVNFTETRIRIIEGEMRPDGFIRVASYKDYAKDPLEWWQLTISLLLLTPRKELLKGETRTEDLEFPCQASHRIHGKAIFTGEGEATLQGCPSTLVKIHVEVELTIENREKGDRITESVAEGRVYWDPTRSVVAAGEWEYANGLPEERYLSGTWNYANFTLEGQDFPPGESDYTTLGMNTLWSWKEDITPEERIMRTLQKNARDQLNQIANAQEVFKEEAIVDQDRDGKGEYGLLTEVTGASMLIRTPGGSGPGPQPRPQIPIRDTYGNVNASGFSTVDDYHFQVFLKTAAGLITDGATPAKGDPSSADVQEAASGWCGFAWPAEYGKTGKAVYFTNGPGNLWESKDFVLSGATKAPKPVSTDLPAEGQWKRVSITDPTPVNPYILIMIRGQKLTEEAHAFALEIQFYRPQLDQLGYSKALNEFHFREMEKLGRAYSKARADGIFSAQEAKVIRDGYEKLFRKVYMDSALHSLAQAEFNLSEKSAPDPDGKLAAAISEAKVKAARIRDNPTPSIEVVDAWEECNSLLEKTTPMPGR